MLGTANIKVRPLRFALLVDPKSTVQVRHAIRLACSLWGGAFFPIISLYKRMPDSWRDAPLRAPSSKEVILGYLDAFDPDVLVQFASSVPAYITARGLPIIKPQDLWKTHSTDSYAEPSRGIGVFDVLNDVYQELFRYKSKYPTKVVIPKIPARHALFWTSVFGEFPEHISRVVEANYQESLEIERPEAAPKAFSLIADREILFPRRITTWRIRGEGGPGSGRNACIFFMSASSVEDIVDYWNLRASGRQVVPIPKEFAKDEWFRAVVEQFLIRERRAWRHDPKHFDVASFVRGRNSAMNDMASYASSLKTPTPTPGDLDSYFYTLQHWYPRFWNEWARGKDGGVADIFGEEEDSIEMDKSSDLELRLKPLLPKFLRQSWISSEGLCANEFDLRVFGSEEYLAEVYPKTQGSHLDRAISGTISMRGEWRVGRRGLVKVVRSSLSESRTVPASETIFFAWLADQGWTAKLSPPGILAKEIFRRLGGYSRLLTNKAVLTLIEHMNGGAISRNGTPTGEERVVAPRELPVGEVKEKLKPKSGHSGVYDLLIKTGVFKLGLKTKCPKCQRNSWFAMSSLGEALSCPKCLNSFAAAGTIDQTTGGWCYRTAGPFSVPNFAEGAYAVLMTLDFLSDHRATRRTTAVPSFIAASPGKRDLEADFAMLWQETVFGEEVEGSLFGECKTYGAFQAKDIARMQHLADNFPGAVLVFSTLREGLTPKEVVALRRVAARGRKYWKAERPVNPVLVLTGTELLGWGRPPLCWKKEDQDRFRDVYGLLSLCDATQQLYLGLPPTHDDWHRRWEKNRERLKSRSKAIR
jgi:hypothetical protein